MTLYLRASITLPTTHGTPQTHIRCYTRLYLQTQFCGELSRARGFQSLPTRGEDLGSCTYLPRTLSSPVGTPLDALLWTARTAPPPRCSQPPPVFSSHHSCFLVSCCLLYNVIFCIIVILLAPYRNTHITYKTH